MHKHSEHDSTPQHQRGAAPTPLSTHNGGAQNGEVQKGNAHSGAQQVSCPAVQEASAERRSEPSANDRADELAKARMQGRREGLAKGLQQGRAAGLAKGLGKGRAHGLAEGYAKGHVEGYALDRDVDLATGRREGLAKACVAAEPQAS